MDTRDDERMRRNLRKGLALIALGAVAVVAVELIWDHVQANRFVKPGENTCPWCAEEARLHGDGMRDFVFGVGDPRLGEGDVPQAFLDECFDPSGFGEAHCSYDGGVVGVVSEYAAPDLFRLCADALGNKGWVQVNSGQGLRSTFFKESGALGWLFLDVAQIADSGVAVLVVDEGVPNDVG